MHNNKYKKVLTVVLIIAIIAIISLIAFLIYEQIEKDKTEKDALAAIEEFDRVHGVGTEATKAPEEIPSLEEPGGTPTVVPPTGGGSGSGSSGGSSSTISDGKSYYKGFVMIGYVDIPKTGAKYPILEKVTIKSLSAAVVLLYPANAKLNEPGNVVIAGHNYRNSTFFSKNKTLKEGDKIYITDESGRKLTYTVYSNFQATAEDTSFYKRDTGGVPEITLTTCVQNDSSKRTIILARAN